MMQARTGLRSTRYSRAFTLVETMVVLAVVAILVVASGASFGAQLARHRVSTAAREMVASLDLARTMALMRGRVASVCPSLDGLHCAGAGYWARGWIVFLDRDRNGRRDATDRLLAVTTPNLTGITIGTTSTRARVQFLPDGRAAGSTITFTICSTRNDAASARVIVSNVGRVRRVAGTGCSG
jgi:type IV fimbrial biogenesis protein FimT